MITPMIASKANPPLTGPRMIPMFVFPFELLPVLMHMETKKKEKKESMITYIEV